MIYNPVNPNPGRFAFIIPVYNHAGMVESVIEKTRSYKYPIIVIDDGSTDGTADRLAVLKDVKVITHPVNRGKGAAIKTGFNEAAGIADWAITIDADGQHDPADAAGMIASIPVGERPIVIGARRDMIGEDVPWTSRFGRGFSNFWVRASGGPPVNDSQSGFRIYPIPECIRLDARAERYQFEVEILARAGWKGIPVIEAPISVVYSPPTGRISHFRPFIDFCRNSSVFSGLIFRRIFIPRLFRRKW